MAKFQQPLCLSTDTTYLAIWLQEDATTRLDRVSFGGLP
jgi:hypothetical protein